MGLVIDLAAGLFVILLVSAIGLSVLGAAVPLIYRGRWLIGAALLAFASYRFNWVGAALTWAVVLGVLWSLDQHRMAVLAAEKAERDKAPSDP